MLPAEVPGNEFSRGGVWLAGREPLLPIVWRIESVGFAKFGRVSVGAWGALLGEPGSLGFSGGLGFAFCGGIEPMFGSLVRGG